MEAGGKNDAKSLRVDGQRWSTQLVEHTNWGYKTVPQKQCNNRKLPFSRGKGLGGSTAINFGTWAFGARDDYDKWAEDVGDDALSWKRVQERLKALECLDEQSLAVKTSNNTVYAAPNPTHHGFTGPLRVGFARELEADLPLVLDVFEQAGFARNLDVNDGNPLGMSLGFNSFSLGLRSTAADLLVDVPDNLVVITDQAVQRVVFDGQRAVGVELKDGKCKPFFSFAVYLSNYHRLRSERGHPLCRSRRNAEYIDAFWYWPSQRTPEVPDSGSLQYSSCWTESHGPFRGASPCEAKSPDE